MDMLISDLIKRSKKNWRNKSTELNYAPALANSQIHASDATYRLDVGAVKRLPEISTNAGDASKFLTLPFLRNKVDVTDTTR